MFAANAACAASSPKKFICPARGTAILRDDGAAGASVISSASRRLQGSRES